MIKKALSISALAMLIAVGTQAQSKADKTESTPTETNVVKDKVEPFSADEEAAAKQRILNYQEKIMANKDNEAIDYEAEKMKIIEMKARFNERAATKID
jgi:methionine-rich copper-binding protein CopC